MKKWIIICLLFIAIVVSAEDFNDTVFVQFYQALDSLNHIKNEVAPATFSVKNKVYNGYEITFETKWSILDKEADPMLMFYPFEDSYWYNAGWKADLNFSADGPGSTNFLIRKGEYFCKIRWEYTASIDENGKITYDVLCGRIKCATEIKEED